MSCPRLPTSNLPPLVRRLNPFRYSPLLHSWPGSFPIRFITPPLFLLASLNYFHPKLSHNLSSYYVDLERAHAPQLMRQRESLVGSLRNTFQSATHKVEQAKSGAERGLRTGLNEVEKNTGLKFGDVLGSAEEKAHETKIKLQQQMKAV